jgi:dihydrolipoamide dehydrogenase
MKKYDAIIIGSGCGSIIVGETMAHGLKTAMIDKGPLIGGTCLNYGCIPSKQLIYPADKIAEIQDSAKLGITTRVEKIDFAAMMERVRKSREESQQEARSQILLAEDLAFYEGETRFVGDRTLEVKGQKIEGEHVFIAAGSRPFIPPIKGLDTVPYLTNESVLEMKEKPDSLIIIGGGYVAVEYGHFFAAMGTKVTILEMADRLVLSEEPEIARLLEKKLGERLSIFTGARVEEVGRDGGGVTVLTRGAAADSATRHKAQRILVAVGRRSNTDSLNLAATGVEVDEKGFIKVNPRLETNRKNTYAVGDIIGRAMFTHMANREAATAADNVVHGAKSQVDFNTVPHAVYSWPQIAAVGMTEEEARRKHKVAVGRARYYDVAKGEAMLEMDGFAKAILDAASGKILGFHIIGPYAPELIQEVVNAMRSGGISGLNRGIHIHPALSELVPTAINRAEPV